MNSAVSRGFDSILINNLFTMYSMSGDPDDFESLVNYEYNAGIITAMMHTISTKDVVHIASNIENFLAQICYIIFFEIII